MFAVANFRFGEILRKINASETLLLDEIAFSKKRFAPFALRWIVFVSEQTVIFIYPIMDNFGRFA